jgi:hypothetical protein
VLSFDLGAGVAVLDSNAQIWSRTLNTAIGGDVDANCLVVADVSCLSWVTWEYEANERAIGRGTVEK